MPKRNAELEVTPAGPRRCSSPRCGAVLPDDARADARYCGARCRVSAMRQRQLDTVRERWTKHGDEPRSCCWRGSCECTDPRSPDRLDAKLLDLEALRARLDNRAAASLCGAICPPIPRSTVNATQGK